MLAEIVLLSAIGLIVYTYVGYPALVFLWSRLYRRPVRRADITPRVSVIIAAHNEERDLAAKLENTLALDYPRDKLEVIVASDCSTDRTDDIVRSYAGRGVLLCRQPERRGKTACQNQAVEMASGDILVFSDATTRYEPSVLRQIVRSFADPTVGCVAGQLVYEDRSATAVGAGCRSYWGYEKFIKRCESELGSLIGVSGCLYALRARCHRRLAADMIEDFVVATEVHLQGLRTVYEPEAVATEDTNSRSGEEFQMRVRVMQQTMSALLRYRGVLNPWRHGMYAVQMISHKVLRYAMPAFLLAAWISSWALANAALFRLVWVGQAVFYATALLGWWCDQKGIKPGPLALPYYLVLGNAAVVAAFWRLVRGDARVVWQPVRESPVLHPDRKAL
jgi:cellulose synthase/poly-beta-1,6-N-acetylglucosamine synthase-like glycosyltransferase